MISSRACECHQSGGLDRLRRNGGIARTNSRSQEQRKQRQNSQRLGCFLLLERSAARIFAGTEMPMAVNSLQKQPAAHASSGRRHWVLQLIDSMQPTCM